MGIRKRGPDMLCCGGKMAELSMVKWPAVAGTVMSSRVWSGSES
jgi:hypothetical protein